MTTKAYINTFKTNVVFNYKSHQLLNKPDVLIYVLTIFENFQKSKLHHLVTLSLEHIVSSG